MTRTASDDEFRGRHAIEGDLCTAFAEYVWDRPYALTLGGGKFRSLYAEEAEELGYGEDDATVLLRRESDGKVFEVDIDVTVRPVPTPAERAESAGQLPLPGVSA